MGINNNIVDVSVYIENEERYNEYFGRLFETKTSLIKPNQANINDDSLKNLEMKSIYIPENGQCGEMKEENYYVVSIFKKTYRESLKDMRLKYSDIIITDNKKVVELFASKSKGFEFLDELIKYIQK